jgi:capsular polysaccharide biosynthesis protein
MKEPGHDAVGILRWGIRRYRWLFLACLLLGAVVAPYAASKLEKPADAEALVIAQRMDMSLTALPRYGETVFDNGQVAGAVAQEFGDTVDLRDIVPDHVSLIADQDSIVFRVVGHDRDPKTAADVANTASVAFVEALNTPGVGVGQFSLLSPAEPPPAPGRNLSRALAIPVGVITGAVLGLAAVSMLLAVRRPVVDAAGVEEATGVPGLGTVAVPRTRRGEFARPHQFPGLVPVCRRLLRLKTPTIVLVSRSRDQGRREQVSVALAGVLMRVRPLRFTGPNELREAVTEYQAALHPAVSHPDGLDGDTSDGGGRADLTVIDSNDPLDLVQPPDLTAAVLVAREGISSAALRAAVVEHLGGSAEARVLLVKRGRRLRRNAQSRSTEAETAQVEELSLRP